MNDSMKAAIKSLLVIDDDDVDTCQVEKVIKASGMVEHIYAFRNGEEALDCFTHLEESKMKFKEYFPPQVVLLDINMPRMNGFEFLEGYSKLSDFRKSNLIVVMLTSSDQEKDRAQAAKHEHVKDYFIKPFNKEHLEKILEWHSQG